MSRELEIPWEEEFVLEDDKFNALRKLLPTSEDYYFYNTLHELISNGYPLSKDGNNLLQQYAKKYPYSSKFSIIKNRIAVMEYDSLTKKSSKATSTFCDTLAKMVNAAVSSTPPVVESIGDVEEISRKEYPSSLTTKYYSADSFINQENFSVFNINPIAYELYNKKVSNDPINLLKYISNNRGLNPNLSLPVLISVLNNVRLRGDLDSFTFKKLLNNMTIKDLDKLKGKSSYVFSSSEFIQVYLTKLCPKQIEKQEPNFDVIAKTMLQFTNSLSPSYKYACLLISYNLLTWYREMNLQSSNEAIKLFNSYIVYPRSNLSSTSHFKGKQNIFFSSISVPNLNPLDTTSDKNLIKQYLQDHFRNPKNTSLKPYSSYLDENFLKETIAEAKLFGGADELTWCKDLDPSSIQSLKEQVKIDFLENNLTKYSINENVVLTVLLKNVTQVIKKVFEINSLGYYLQHKSEINTAINLDGLIASEEEIITCEIISPFKTITKTIEFPSINKRGIYVIELIGNGISSRALIRKGELHYVDTLTAEGHNISILNETYEKEKNASIWMDNITYSTNENGNILIPFCDYQQEKLIILSTNDFSSLTQFQHKSEEYSLRAGISIDRESLIPSNIAKIFIKPTIYLSGSKPISLSVLKSLTCTITTQIAGDSESKSEQTIDFDLTSDKHIFEANFVVPPFLKTITVNLQATVNSKRANILYSNKSISINSNQSTDQITDCFLRATNTGYSLLFLGRNGESQKNIQATVYLTHKHFTTEIQYTLESDTTGTIDLGTLELISNIRVSAPNISKSWELNQELQTSIPSVIHKRFDESIDIYTSYLVGSLVSIIGKEIITDYTHVIKKTNDKISIPSNTLPTGTYELFWKHSSVPITIRIIDMENAKHIDDWLVYKGEFIEYSPNTSVNNISIDSIKSSKTSLNIKLSNSTSKTRCHIISTLFVPSFYQYQQLQVVKPYRPQYFYSSAQLSFYTSGRELSDEYRYIIDRKYIKQYPHLILDKPTLLSTPWVRAEVKDSQGFAAAGTSFDDKGDKHSRHLDDMNCENSNTLVCNDKSCIDFLKQGSIIISNLQPNENGVVSIPYSDVFKNGTQFIQIIVTDDDSVVGLNYLAPKASEEIPLRNLALENPLTLDSHYVEKSQISIVSPNTSLKFSDGVSSDNFTVYDSLSDLYNYYKGKMNNEYLRTFNFILNWNSFNDDEKIEKYIQYACNELNFFLFHKDNMFFNSIILPHIKLKRSKSFLDYYLLNDIDNLQKFTEPWRFTKLNLIEQILLSKILKILPILKNIMDKCVKKTVIPKPSANVFIPRKRRNLGIRASRSPPRNLRRTSLCYMPKRKLSLCEMQLSDDEDYDNCSFDSCDYSLSVTQERKSINETIPQPILESKNTLEYEEQGYYRSANPNITTSPFWFDYCNYINTSFQQTNLSTFVSRNVTEIGNNFTEVLFAFAILDLPFNSASPIIEYSTSGNIASITASTSPLIIKYKEFVEVSLSITSSTEAISVVQCIYRSGSPDKFLSSNDDFLPGCVYTSRIVIMNSSTKQKTVDLLYQIPQNSIVLGGSKVTSFTSYVVDSYSTELFEIQYYFPSCGTFIQHPPHVSIDGTPVAVGEHRTFKVVQKLTNIDKNWRYICRFGTDEEVLSYLVNLNSVENDISLISWRLEKKELFTKIIDILRTRYLFSKSIWAWSFIHKDFKAMKEYLDTCNLENYCGLVFDSSIININPIDRNIYQYREYDPLVTSRAHKFGARRKLLNDGLRTQYTNFLKLLCYKKELSNEDLLQLTYYMLLMNRQDEAHRLFSRVDTTKNLTPFDEYFIAYMHFQNSNIDSALKIISEENLNHPVLRIRKRFKQLYKQIDQVQKDTIEFENNIISNQSQSPSFSFIVEDKTLQIEYQNITQLSISYYMMDIEFLFSSNPFMNQNEKKSDMGQFSYVKPTFTEKIELPTDLLSFQTNIPKKFLNSNVMIEITGCGIHKSCPYFAHSLRVHFARSSGKLQVTTKDNKPLSTTYVKVFGKNRNNQTFFYKDGYTDPRGIFDYLYLTCDSKLPTVILFSILLISQNHGSVIHEVEPPKY